jgi:Xaa-Pro aminopeptidase
VRLRNWNLELYYGHVLSGRSGLQGAYCDTPSGGTGFSPAYPQGAGQKRLAPGEPVSIDFCSCINGYVVDQTRTYALGSLPPPAWEAYEAIRELYRLYEAAAVPGAQPGDLYRLLTEEVRRRGYEEYFMGQGVERVNFIGHGVGLELDEYPVITPNFAHPLEENMVLAFEPKIFLPEIGMIGQEDTGRITAQGVEWLTTTPREIVVLGKNWRRGK